MKLGQIMKVSSHKLLRKQQQLLQKTDFNHQSEVGTICTLRTKLVPHQVAHLTLVKWEFTLNTLLVTILVCVLNLSTSRTITFGHSVGGTLKKKTRSGTKIPAPQAKTTGLTVPSATIAKLRFVCLTLFLRKLYFSFLRRLKAPKLC